MVSSVVVEFQLAARSTLPSSDNFGCVDLLAVFADASLMQKFLVSWEAGSMDAVRACQLKLFGDDPKVSFSIVMSDFPIDEFCLKFWKCFQESCK